MKNIHVIPTNKPSRLGYLTKKGKEVFNDLRLFEKPMPNILDSENQHIYITSDEEIKEEDWHYNLALNVVEKTTKFDNGLLQEKIILTTDDQLIQDGIQAIDDEFLEWFVKNPSCEQVEILNQYQYHSSKEVYSDADYVNCFKEQYESIKKDIPTCPLRILYKIIIPKQDSKQYTSEELEGFEDFKKITQPKQETLEEAAERMYREYPNDPLDKTDWKYNRDLNCFKKRKAFKAGAKWQAKRMYSEEEVISIYNEWLKFDDAQDSYNGQDDLTFVQWFKKFKKK